MKNRFATMHMIIEELESMPNVEFVEWRGDFAYQVTPVLVRCTVHGTEWETTPLKLCVQRFKCVDCSRRKAVTECDIINMVNKEDNKFRFVSWEGSFNGVKSILNVTCKDCGDNKVSTYDNVRNAKSCANCRELERVEKMEDEIRSFGDFEFIEWLSDSRMMVSPVLMRCKEHGVEWETTMDNLRCRGMGCPECARERNYGNKTILEAGNIARVNEIDGITYVSTVGNYINTAKSRFIITHDCGHTWEASVAHILHGTGGSCACCRAVTWKQRGEKEEAAIRQGYSSARKGYLYFLVSTNKRFAKVGISNVPDSRIKHLAKVTPFDFTIEGMFEHENGAIARMLETSIHKKYSADNCGFTGGSWGGCTEWFFLTPELEAEMRSLIAP